jgi:hypothetical protein
VAREKLPIPTLGLPDFGKDANESWDEGPSVHVLAVETGISSFLNVGWAPLVSPDGRMILVDGWD